ncbi:MAG: glycosyltransferase family 39 protein [Hyphomicrobiales bacterium]
MTAGSGWTERLRRPEFWILLSLLAVAAFLRLTHLGALSLYGDEDISAAAVRSLCHDGYPHMPSGLLYTRGLPYTVAAAACSLVVHPIELALRLPSALAGILAVALLYRLLRDFTGRETALLAAGLLAFSAWHVDMSREGRMYSMFLCSLLFALLCFDRWIRTQRRWDGVGALAGALLTILLHELGLLVFFVWGLLLYVRRAPRRTVLGALYLALGCGIVWIAYLVQWQISVHAFGSGKAVATPSKAHTGLLTLIRATFHLGHHPSFHLVGAAWRAAPIPYSLAVFASLAVAIALAWRERGTAGSRAVLAALLALLVLASSAGLFGIAAALVFSAVLLLPSRVREAGRSRAGRWSLALSAAWLAAWILWSGAVPLLPGSGERWSLVGGLRGLVLDLFGYPAPHATIYLETMPVMTSLVILATVFLALRRLRSATAPRSDLLLPAWMWLPLLATGLTTRWIALRYALPTYPAFVALDATAVMAAATAGARFLQRHGSGARVAWATPWAVGALVLIVPFANEYHGLVPAWRTAELNYRDPIETEIHGYPFHPDHQSAGRWVRARLRAGDVVVAADEMVQTEYVGHVDYWLRGQADARYFSYIRDGVPHSFYTNDPILERVDELEALIAEPSAGRVWVITSAELSGRLDSLNPPGLDRFLAAHQADRVYTARDGMTQVYRFARGATP